MSTLFNIADDFIKLFETFDDEDLDIDTMQAYFDTLEGIEAEFNLKAENVALFIKNLKAEALALETEEKVLRERRRQKERKAESMIAYLKSNMEACGLTKIECPKAKISIRNNAESVQIVDELTLISWAQENNEELLKYSLPEIKKTELKKLLQANQKIPACSLIRTQSLIIK